MGERTFLDPLNEAEQSIREVMSGLDELIYCFQVTGNVKIAIRLRDFGNALTTSTNLIEEGRSIALRRFIHGAEQATTNMVSAALAALEQKSATVINESQTPT